MIFEREQLKECIKEAADILHRKADAIVADVEDEIVTDISVTMFIRPGEAPTIEIGKSYLAWKVESER